MPHTKPALALLRRSAKRSASSGGPQTDDAARALLADGLRLHEEGDVVGATRAYGEVLARFPNDPDALHLLGLASHQLGHVAGAKELISRAVRLRSPFPQAHMNLGNVLRAAGAAEEAVREYQEALRQAGDQPDIHYNLGIALTQAGRRDDAMRAYAKACEIDPSHAKAQFNLGNLFLELDRPGDAVPCFEAAARVEPEFALAHNNLALALLRSGERDRAAAAFAEAVRTDPDCAQAHNNLGSLLVDEGKPKDGVAHLDRALHLQPDDADVCVNLALAHLRSGDARQALQAGKRALAINPGLASAHNMVGNVYLELFQPDDALPHYDRCIEIAPSFAEGHLNRGTALRYLKRYEGALEAYDRAVELDPSLSSAYNDIGIAYHDTGRLKDAFRAYHKALSINPLDGKACSNIGLALKDAGLLDESLDMHRKAIALAPESDEVFSNYFLCQTYSPAVTPAEMLETSVEWAERKLPASLAQDTHDRDRTPDRKLRIGYLSADFHAHPAGYIYQALFPCHDRSNVEVYLYANQAVGDEVTRSIVQSSDRWAMVRGMSDEDLARQIDEDRVDVLVDLLGHTGNHRLGVFARKPAPVQATWLGYFGTTGMRQIDYIIADRWVIPTNEEQYYVEKPARLPGCMYVFNTPTDEIPVRPLPALTTGHVTFGCFNNTAKITPEVVELWSRVLRAVPSSRLALNRWPFRSAEVRERYLSLFADNGVEPERIEIRSTSTRREYLESYDGVDIMMDTFPFGGGTTTFEALWMGVPVITLPAGRFVGHMTESIVHTAALSNLLPNSEDDFVARAIGLASDTGHLTELRAGLRERVRESPLCDPRDFANKLENAFRTMWLEYIQR